MRLRAPMPKTFPVLWGDYKTTEKEILLLENLENEGFVSPRLSSEGKIYFIYIFFLPQYNFWVTLKNKVTQRNVKYFLLGLDLAHVILAAGKQAFASVISMTKVFIQ